MAVAQRETLGADRLCNAAAAWAASLAPALVIDAGTAVTVDLVDAGGVYRGGAILPGQSLTLRALGAGAEQLFEARPDWPPSPGDATARRRWPPARSGAGWPPSKAWRCAIARTGGTRRR